MMKFNKLVLLLLLISSHVQAMFNDDPTLTKVMSELEYIDDDVVEWDVDAWWGRDLSKFWLKSSGEIINSEVEEANIELVYSRAVSAYWDQQFGIRYDVESEFAAQKRAWLSYGYIGLAPYFVDVDARVFVGEQSSSQLLIELEREVMLTQTWVLTPELDIVANGRTNEDYGEGRGLAEIEFSVRLGYEHRGNRQFQPFVGLSHVEKFGRTKTLARQRGESTRDLEVMVGLHFWF